MLLNVITQTPNIGCFYENRWQILIIGNSEEVAHLEYAILKRKYLNIKIVPNFFSIIIAVIVGGALVKEFDFQNLKFENPALAIVYIITFIICIGFMIKKSKNN